MAKVSEAKKVQHIRCEMKKQFHDEIEELRRQVRVRNEIIDKQEKKIVELQQELAQARSGPELDRLVEKLLGGILCAESQQ